MSSVSMPSTASSADSYCIVPKNVSRYLICEYVLKNSDQCEGGGYLDWTKFVMCEDSTGLRAFLVIVAIIWLALLFVAISVGADDFFSTNVSTITAQLRLSESIAGVTLMAFANGSPDVFGSMLQKQDWVPFDGGPGFWIFPLGVSLIFVAILLCITFSDVEPRWFPIISPYLGFVMSVAWIYAISDEVVSVVTMLGVFSGISQEVLGLTVIAWSNCIGDICADIAVARQGYPRMAAAAAIDLLIGFGLPFTIAAARDPSRSLPLSFSTTSRLLVGFLLSSLVFSAAAIIVQQFRLRRIYAASLLAIYSLFILLMILSETHVIRW